MKVQDSKLFLNSETSCLGQKLQILQEERLQLETEQDIQFQTILLPGQSVAAVGEESERSHSVLESGHRGTAASTHGHRGMLWTTGGGRRGSPDPGVDPTPGTVVEVDHVPCAGTGGMGSESPEHTFREPSPETQLLRIAPAAEGGPAAVSPPCPF